MPNLLFLSPHNSFAQDLSSQLKLYAPDFSLYTEDDGTIVFDLIVLDEPDSASASYINRQVPVLLLLPESDNAEYPGAEAIYKPLSLHSFLNQLKSAIHFYDNSEEGILQFNNYELHPVAKEIINFRNQETIKLTEKEVSILKYLYKSGDKIISKNELLSEVWGYNPEITTHTIETHIYRLRQKVEQNDSNAQLIQTSEGGYQLKL